MTYVYDLCIRSDSLWSIKVLKLLLFVYTPHQFYLFPVYQVLDKSLEKIILMKHNLMNGQFLYSPFYTDSYLILTRHTQFRYAQKITYSYIKGSLECNTIYCLTALPE